MIQKIEKIEANDLKLQEDLERRFGEAMAQEIMAEIKKADGLTKGFERHFRLLQHQSPIRRGRIVPPRGTKRPASPEIMEA